LANSGLAGALKVASQKGYIEKDVKKSVNVDQKHKERIRNCVFFYNKSTFQTFDSFEHSVKLRLVTFERSKPGGVLKRASLLLL